MQAETTTTETMKISEARANLNTLVNRIYRKEMRVVVEKSGIPVAAIVSLDDLERLERLERELAARVAVIDEFRKPFDGALVEGLEREADRITAEIRDESRRWHEEAAVSR